MAGDQLKVFKVRGRRFGLVGALALAETVGAATFTDASKNFVMQLSDRADQQSAQLGTIVSQADRITDGGDQKIIETYYNQTRAAYIANPTNAILKTVNVENALENYTNELQGLFDSSTQLSRAASRNNRTASKEAEDKTDAIFNEVEFKKCVSTSVNFSNLSSAKARAVSSLESLSRTVNTSYRFRSIGYRGDSGWDGRKSLEQGLAAFDKDLGAIVKKCCDQKNLESQACGTYQSQAMTIQKNLASHFSDVDYPEYAGAPDPLAVNELTGQDLAEIISQRKSVLTGIRTKGSEKYADEQDVFESMSRCRVRAKLFQDTRKPISYQAAFAAAKAIKCSLLPAYAAQNLGTQWAKMSAAVVAVPLEGKNWDINCSPGESEAWNQIIDQTRDPKAWGIDNMANPPYIAGLRGLPPLSTRPTAGLSAEQYLMVTPGGGLGTAVASANVNRTTARPINLSAGPVAGGRIANALTPSSVSSTGLNADVYTRPDASADGGVTRGQQLVGAVRSASSSIRNNDKASVFATKIALGATNTRNFLQTSVTRTAALSRDKVSTTQTDNVRRMVLRSTATTASRTTGAGILNSLNGIGTSTTSTGSITDLGAQNQAVKTQVTGLVQKYLDNISLTVTKGAASRLEILKLVAQYDSLTADVGIDIQNQPPKKIASIIAKARAKQMKIVDQLAAARAGYDAYQTAIYQQESALDRLTTFGPTSADGVLTGAGRGTTRGSSSGASTATTTSTSTMPSGLSTTGRGTTRTSYHPALKGFEWAGVLWQALNPVSSAWAAVSQSSADFERFYASEWKRFVTQFGEYVGNLRKEEVANAHEAGQLIASRKKSITLENYTVLDLDTLTTIDMYLSELDEETGFLLEGQRSKEFNFAGDVTSKLQEARTQTLQAQDAWAEAQVAAFKLAPKSYEQDGRVWWSMVPEILLQ